MGNEAQHGRGRQDLEIRAITEDEIPAWDRALVRGFFRPEAPDCSHIRRAQFLPGRLLGAVDSADPGRFVATFRSFDSELTVPGGATVPVDAVSSVTVNATHRRRGLLGRMMRQDLAAARERGDVAAVLIAAEYNIYGRFGFGPATRADGWRIDIARSGGLREGLPLPVGGRIDFVTMEELGKLGPDLHERWRLTQPGALNRPGSFWQLTTGALTRPEWKEPFAAVHRDADGTVTGLIVYRVDDHWDGGYPDCTLTVQDFLALDRPTAHALWQLAFSADWVRHVSVSNIAPDDPLPLLLTNPRGAKPHEENWDFMWLRLLDLPAAFAARRYALPGRVVLEVADREGYAAGRWALEADADGTGRCTPTDEQPELALDIAQLGTLYLGDESATRLAAAELVTELRPGAAATVDLLLRTARRSWQPDNF